MIQPDGLLEHARRLAGRGRVRRPEADLRRGVSAAYDAAFHEMTDRAARHLVGSAPDGVRNKIRRAWTHGEIFRLANMVVDQAPAAMAAPGTPVHKDLRFGGPLGELAAADAHLVESLRLFVELQEDRHRADYDHDANFEKATLINACDNFERFREELDAAAPEAREALFSMLTVVRSDLKER